MKGEARSYNMTLKVMIGIGLGVSLVALVLGWFYIGQKSLELARVKTEADYLEKEVKALDNLKIKYAKITDSADMAIESLPKTKEISSFIADIESLAERNNLAFSSIVIGGGKATAKITDPEYSQLVKKEGYYELPLKLSFVGSYNSFNNALAEISQMRRLNNISNVEIVNSNVRTGTTDEVKTTINMVIFVKK